MPERVGYLNGQWVPESEMKVSIYDLSCAQGVAAFTMTRSFNKQHFKVPEHLARLKQSCELLRIPLPADFERLPSIIDELTRLNADTFRADDEYRLLIVVSPGCAPMYRDIAGTIPHSYTYATVFPLRYTVKGMGRLFAEGVELVSAGYAMPDEVIPAAAKHRSRGHFHAAQVQHAPFWPVLKNDEGSVTEAPGANVLGVYRGRLIYRLDGCLRGISQQTVIELAEAIGLTPLEGDLDLVAMPDMEEVWLTGTPFCALRARTWLDSDGVTHIFKPPMHYTAMLQAWSDKVGLDIAAQIQRWDAEAGC